MLLRQLEVRICVCACLLMSACVKACVHQHMYPSVHVRVDMYASSHEVSMSVSPVCLRCCSAQRRPAEVTVKRWEQTSPSEGRGVSRQAAGYPIMLGLQLHPFPSTLPSSQIQREVCRGQAGSSLCHYPSITCHPPAADNRTFSSRSSPFTFGTSLSSLWSLTPRDSAFMIFTSFNHLFPCSHSFISLLFVSFCSFDNAALPSVIFSHRFRELRGLAFWGLLLSLQLISRLLQRYFTPTAAFTDRLQIEPISFRGGSLLSFERRGLEITYIVSLKEQLNVCQKYSLNLGHVVMQYRCYVIMDILRYATMYCNRMMW